MQVVDDDTYVNVNLLRYGSVLSSVLLREDVKQASICECIV